jgi:hypothetical protein
MTSTARSHLFRFQLAFDVATDKSNELDDLYCKEAQHIKYKIIIIFTMSMARGLPGFLRRSLRLDSDDENDDDHHNGEADIPIAAHNNNYSTASQSDRNENGKEQEAPSINEDLVRNLKRETSESSNTPQITEKQEDSTVSSNEPSKVPGSYHDDEFFEDEGRDESDKRGEEEDEDGWNDEEEEFRAVISSPPPPTQKKPSYREMQFDKVLAADVVHLTELRKLGWNGIPVRALYL